MYCNWEEKSMDSLNKFRWFLVDDVISYIQSLRRYIIETPGKFSSSYVPQMPGNDENHKCPAEKSKRFSKERKYLCEAIGEWSLLLDQIELAVSIMIHNNRLDRNYPGYKTLGELEHHLLYLIHKLLRVIETKDGFLNRTEFELRYGLTWSETHTTDERKKENIKKNSYENVQANGA